jgi:hypothetical protein
MYEYESDEEEIEEENKDEATVAQEQVLFIQKEYIQNKQRCFLFQILQVLAASDKQAEAAVEIQEAAAAEQDGQEIMATSSRRGSAVTPIIPKVEVPTSVEPKNGLMIDCK